MRESGAVFGLDAKADVVVDGDKHHRRGGIAREGNLQAVGELVVSDGNGEFGRGGLGRRERCQREPDGCYRQKPCDVWQDITSLKETPTLKPPQSLRNILYGG
jgi:hypothetical protein